MLYTYNKAWACHGAAPHPATPSLKRRVFGFEGNVRKSDVNKTQMFEKEYFDLTLAP
jgi:hypothetical protein